MMCFTVLFFLTYNFLYRIVGEISSPGAGSQGESVHRASRSSERWQRTIRSQGDGVRL
jgi:hypothetical protein